MSGELALHLTGAPSASVFAISIVASLLILALAWPGSWSERVPSTEGPRKRPWTRRAVLRSIPVVSGLGLMATSGPGAAAEPDVRSVLERYAAAWRGGDLAAIAACYHDDFTLHYFGDNALSGDHAGKMRALDILRQFSIRTRRRLLDISAILAGPERGALIAREMLMKGDEAIEVERVLVYRIKDGLLAECWIYDQDQRLIDGIIG